MGKNITTEAKILRQKAEKVQKSGNQDLLH